MIKEIKTITVEEAKLLLEGHENLRPLSQQMVDDMVRDIKDGTFDKDQANIVLESDGKLYNGQHIISAIIETETPLELNVYTQEDGEVLVPGLMNMHSKYKYIPPKEEVPVEKPERIKFERPSMRRRGNDD